MTAREYFEGVRACQRAIDRRLAVIASMRRREAVRAQSYEAVGRSSGARDAMAATDARIDAEAAAAADLADMRREVEGGRELCAGVRSANPGKRWGDVLELRYCEDRTLQEIAGALGVSVRSIQADLSAALDWVSLTGIARARQGRGVAEI